MENKTILIVGHAGDIGKTITELAQMRALMPNVEFVHAGTRSLENQSKIIINDFKRHIQENRATTRGERQSILDSLGRRVKHSPEGSGQ